MGNRRIIKKTSHPQAVAPPAIPALHKFAPAPIPDFLENSGPERDADDLLLGRLRLGLTEGQESAEETFYYMREEGSSATTPVTKSMLRACALEAGEKSGQRDAILSIGNSRSEHLVCLMEILEHVGGVENIGGKKIVELGGGTDVRALRLSLALKSLGADVAVVDHAYPRSEGMFVSSDMRQYLDGLEDDSVDVFLAFGVLEEKSHPRAAAMAAFLALGGMFGMDTSEIAEGAPSLADSTASPDFTRGVYKTLSQKLKRGGIAFIMNIIESDAPPLSQAGELGFNVLKTGTDPKSPNSFSIRILTPKKPD